MEKLKKVRIPDQSFANHALPNAFLHSSRKLWEFQEFAETVTPATMIQMNL